MPIMRPQNLSHEYKQTYAAITFGFSQIETIIVQNILKFGQAKVKVTEKTTKEFLTNLHRIAEKHNLHIVFDSIGQCRLQQFAW